ncbi:Sbal_3080 family lipoprotein [Vibrio brasiliensis]|uniref:Sbal_3080 family lipoprotein n=1 Tax=Vibrio brasiliensis TaxID=170652 RepID=UPI001EFC6D76|nr:Sbal_3080 family lipoprotein [Vibrio brasiliensis]MCG9647963.1 Sbal_3080 family lipoprotein [Vibrio brasiliensis]
MEIKKLIAVSVLAALATGCASSNVKPVNTTNNQITDVCIVENEAVRVSDFLDVLENRLNDNGINTAVYKLAYLPKECTYTLRYTARRSWDIVPYMATAEMKLKQGHKQIGRASYDVSGFDLIHKWRGTEYKMHPVIDELFNL